MFFPIHFGLSKFGSEDEESFYRLIRGMQGIGGYADEDDSNRMYEIRAQALIAAIAANAIGRASEQAWPDRATEMLDEWEQVFVLPNNATRTQQERQARLRACRAARCTATSIEAAALLGGASETPSDVLLSFDYLDFTCNYVRYMIADED